MFNLIIAIVSIALVVAVLAASGYFGGDAATSAQATAEATRLVSEEVQIFAAMDMFEAENKRLPTTLEELMTAGFLRSIPKGVALSQQVASVYLELIPNAHAAPVSSDQIGWGLAREGIPVIQTAAKVPRAVCQAYNRVSRGDNGILHQPFEVLPAQCYGTAGSYQVVVHKPAVQLGGLLNAQAVDGALPSKGAAGWWDVPPGAEITQPTDPSKTPKPLLILVSAPPSLDFGQVQLGQQAKSSPLIVSNQGPGVATNFRIKTPDGFAVSESSCGTELKAGSSCTFVVTFSPGAAQTYSGKVMSQGEQGGLAVLPAVGEGVKGAVTFTGVNFGGQPAGNPITRDALLVNTGVGPITLPAPTVEGAGFALAPASTCGHSLAAGDSCAFRVIWTPAGQTAHAGAISLNIPEYGMARADLAGQSRETIHVNLTVTKSGSVVIPANVSGLTLTGKGGPGGDNTVQTPGQPYIAPTAEQAEVKGQPYKAATYKWAMYSDYAEWSENSYGVGDTCAISPAQPTGPGQYATCSYQMIGHTGLYFFYQYYFAATLDAPAQPYVESKPYVPASAGQPYIAASQSGGPTYGTSTTATVTGVTYTFLGGLGTGVAGALQQHSPVLSSSEAQTLSFTIPDQGSLNYQYRYSLPY